MHRIAAIPALLIAAAISWFLWAHLGRPIQIVDVPRGHLQCLSYTPATDGASPLNAKDGLFHVPDGMVERDLKILSQYTDCIRTYSMLGDQGKTMKAAHEAGIKVLVGIWIGSDDERNEKEIARALELAHQYPENVRAIVVGNEVMLRREMTGERLAGIIRLVKARTTLPVTYADIYEFWRRNPVLADAVDMVTVHVLPYWDDPHPVTIDEVQAHARGIIEDTQKLFPGKTIQIGEIGWPSAGRTRSGAAPTLVNEARFVREFAAQAESIGVPYNLIEAIDQPWKRMPEGTVGGYWGILDKDRKLKFPLTGPVSEWPQWHLAAGFTAVVSLLAVLWALLWRKPIPVTRWLGLGVTAPAVGATLWALGAQLGLIVLNNWWGYAWISLLMLIAAIGGALLIYAVAGGRNVPKPSGFDGVLEALRTRRFNGSQIIGAYHWAVMLPAAVLAVSMAIDGRHRDFLQLAFWLPAAAFLLLSLQPSTRERSNRSQPEEGWIAALTLIAGPFAIDQFINHEAVIWALTCIALSVPWLGFAWREARRVGAALSGRTPTAP
jgi:glucan 1,3-beta-glucosidase